MTFVDSERPARKYTAPRASGEGRARDGPRLDHYQATLRPAAWTTRFEPIMPRVSRGRTVGGRRPTATPSQGAPLPPGIARDFGRGFEATNQHLDKRNQAAMPQTWKTEKGEDEECPKCHSVYEVTVSRYPARDQGQFKCEVCGQVVRKWNDTYDWSHKLKRRGGPAN